MRLYEVIDQLFSLPNEEGHKRIIPEKGVKVIGGSSYLYCAPCHDGTTWTHRGYWVDTETVVSITQEDILCG